MNLLQYFETSASTNLNVDLFFYTVVFKAYEIEQQGFNMQAKQDELFTLMNQGGTGYRA